VTAQESLIDGLIIHLNHVEELLMSIDERLAAGASGVSSVEIKTSTRGVDVTTKAYAGSPIQPAGDAAMDEFIRVGREIERRLMDGFEQTAAMAKAKR
jgi:hypothetical protein